jgi:hypothetical protein
VAAVRVVDAQVVVEVLAVVGALLQLRLDLARLALDEPIEQLVERPAGPPVVDGAGAEERVLLEPAGVHDEVVESAVTGRHLQRELVSLGAEGHVAQGAVQLFELPPHIDQVLA